MPVCVFLADVVPANCCFNLSISLFFSSISFLNCSSSRLVFSNSLEPAPSSVFSDLRMIGVEEEVAAVVATVALGRTTLMVGDAPADEGTTVAPTGTTRLETVWLPVLWSTRIIFTVRVFDGDVGDDEDEAENEDVGEVMVLPPKPGIDAPEMGLPTTDVVEMGLPTTDVVEMGLPTTVLFCPFAPMTTRFI